MTRMSIVPLPEPRQPPPDPWPRLNNLLAGIILAPFVAIAIAAAALERLPDPRAVWWLTHNLKARRIR